MDSAPPDLKNAPGSGSCLGRLRVGLLCAIHRPARACLLLRDDRALNPRAQRAVERARDRTWAIEAVITTSYGVFVTE